MLFTSLLLSTQLYGADPETLAIPIPMATLVHHDSIDLPQTPSSDFHSIPNIPGPFNTDECERFLQFKKNRMCRTVAGFLVMTMVSVGAVYDAASADLESGGDGELPAGGFIFSGVAGLAMGAVIYNSHKLCCCHTVEPFDIYPGINHSKFSGVWSMEKAKEIARNHGVNI